MKILTDTGAWIALADKNDQHHQSAAGIYQLIQKSNTHLVITDYIFDETVTWLHYKIGHDIACKWGDKILNSRMVETIKMNDENFRKAWKLFQNYSDQKFSFTDCVSFEVMKKYGIKTAFAFDSHFLTMGFFLLGGDLNQAEMILAPK